MDARDDFLAGLLRGAVPEVKEDFEAANRSTLGNFLPEKRLMLAVFQDAIQTLRSSPRTYKRSWEKKREDPRADAEDWIASEDTDWIFSFVSVCENLGLEPAAVRKQLLSEKRAA